MRILVTGSRTWTDRDSVWRVLDGMLFAPGAVPIVVVHGAAAGVDTLAEGWVEARALASWPVESEVHPAHWVVHGRKAGILRNIHMVGLGADLCLAFIRDNSRGATHCATAAHMAGIETRIERWV